MRLRVCHAPDRQDCPYGVLCRCWPMLACEGGTGSPAGSPQTTRPATPNAIPCRHVWRGVHVNMVRAPPATGHPPALPVPHADAHSACCWGPKNRQNARRLAGTLLCMHAAKWRGWVPPTQQPPSPRTPHTAPADTPAPTARAAEAGAKRGGFGCDKGPRRAAWGVEPRWGRLGGKGGKGAKGVPARTEARRHRRKPGQRSRRRRRTDNKAQQAQPANKGTRGGAGWGAKAHVVGGNQGGALIGTLKIKP